MSNLHFEPMTTQDLVATNHSQQPDTHNTQTPATVLSTCFHDCSEFEILERGNQYTLFHIKALSPLCAESIVPI